MLGGMEIGMDTSNRRGSRDIIRAEFLSFIYWHWDVGAFEFSSLSFGTHCRLTNQPSHLTNRSKFWRADWNVLSVLNLFIFWCWTIFLFGKRMCVLEESLLFEAVVAQLPLLSVPCIEFGSTRRSFRKTEGEVFELPKQWQ